ncbi:MAG: PIG-L deacetylase family protein, partial [Nitrospinota bacterium]
DIEFCCSGTVARWTQEGREVAYCLLTSGEKGLDGPSPVGEKRLVREAEQREAARAIGVEEVHFLRFTDGELVNNRDLRRAIVRILRELRPELVLAPDPARGAFDNFYGCHSDHRAAGEACFDSLYPAAGNPQYFPELPAEGLLPHRPKEAYFVIPQSPNVWVDIGETFELKLRALACHRSQVGEDLDGLAARMREWAQKVGEPRGIALAESFRSLEVPG